MESFQPTDDGTAEKAHRTAVPRPTEHDRENERVRREIADAQLAAYTEVLKWALGAFGPGWNPSHRHFLLEKDEEDRCRYTEERPNAAKTVYTVKNAKGEKRHFTVEDGKVVKHESYEAGFGTMLLEPHPSRGFEHRGVWCRIHRYSLCWAPYELYNPKTADQLAALRESRERKKAEREERKWKQENPLLAWAGLDGRDGGPGSIAENTGPRPDLPPQPLSQNAATSFTDTGPVPTAVSSRDSGSPTE